MARQPATTELTVGSVNGTLGNQGCVSLETCAARNSPAPRPQNADRHSVR